MMKEKNNKDIGYGEAIGLVWDILITILVATTLFAFGGRWLDTIFHTRFIFTSIGLVLLIGVGYRIIQKKGRAIEKRLHQKKSDSEQT